MLDAAAGATTATLEATLAAEGTSAAEAILAAATTLVASPALDEDIIGTFPIMYLNSCHVAYHF